MAHLTNSSGAFACACYLKRMTTQRARPRPQRKREPEHVEPSLLEARIAIEHELSELSAYLDACATDRVTLGEWSETWE